MTSNGLTPHVLCYAEFKFPVHYLLGGGIDHICRFCGTWASSRSPGGCYNELQGWWLHGHPNDALIKPDEYDGARIPCCDHCTKDLALAESSEPMVLGFKFHVDNVVRCNE